MKHTIIVMVTAICSHSLADQGQTKFVNAVIIDNNNEKHEGLIHRSFKSKGKLVFLSPDNTKRTYSPSEIKGFSIDSVNYISYSNDFYRVVLSGKKASLYQKCTNNTGEVIYNGTQAVGFVKTTEGNIGDYYLRIKSGAELELISRNKCKNYFIKLFDGNDSLIARIKNNRLKYDEITQLVRLYNE
jgi:hypothetical protein